MSRVVLGRAARCVGAAAAVLTLLCCAGPALGKPLAGISSDGAVLSGSPPLGHALAARLTTATASRACASTSTSVWSASTSELRAAVICLINHTRARRGLPRLYEQGQLDAAAQGHSDSMVGQDFFGHGDPASRISAAGFDWGTYGEAISTGYGTPWEAVWGWLASTEHCQILLSPSYRFIGIGVNPRGVAGWAGSPGTWTADLALPLGSSAPSGNWGPANGCPY